MGWWDWMASVGHAAWQRLLEFPAEFTSFNSRFFAGYLLCTVLIAAVLYGFEQAAHGRSWRDFWAWLMPRQIYGHPSFRVDLGLKIVNQLLLPGAWLVEGLALQELDDWLILHGRAWLEGPWWPGEPSLAIKLLIGLWVFCVFDFSMYLHHWMQHRWPVLWELHRVHHSADHLNPLTADRFHPLEEMLKGVVIVPLVGLAVGLAGIGFELHVVEHGYKLVEIWVFYRAFNIIGANLRHMHIWWSWPAPLAHVLSTPAQHQIHHSIDPVHYGKNMGSFFSLWDWMFGTLYQPREREQLVFGVNEGQDHRHVGRALWQPLVGMWKVLRRPHA